MKILGYLLLTVALAAGGASCFLWRYHHNQARIAAAQQQNALSTVNDWETSEALDLRNAEAQMRNDQLALNNDDLEVQIAELEGHSTASARSRRVRDEAVLSADKTYLELAEDARAFGPSKHVRDAQNDAAIAEQRVITSSLWIARAERCLYFAVALLVLAGFAFGFATLRPAQQT